MASSPIGYQPFQTYQQYPPPPLAHVTPPPNIQGIERTLQEMCQRMANIETKLTTLDKIESRLNKMETKFGSMDNEIIDCKKRISTLDQSAQFLSNAHDDLKGLKLKVDTINSGVELTKNENKEVRDKLVDIESQNLKQNLVFFELEEASENNEGAKGGATGEKGGATGSTYNENCVNKILEFCENQLKIENAKDKITLEKAYRLGKRKNGAAKPRPIVVKFRKFEDREMIRSVSNRLKNTNYGISPQYPKEVLERRKKLVPIMLKERKKNKKAYIAGDKLYVNGELWKE